MGDKLTREDYKNAIDVQDACNLSGVVFAFAEVMKKICNEDHDNKRGTDWKNNHPIAVMYASKIASLTNCDATVAFLPAYEECVKQAQR
jgi:phosphate/sulfate permease